jgi:hypothetical protein
MTNEKIYEVDYKKLVNMLTPTPLRKTKFISFVYVLVYSIDLLYRKFISFRKDTNYWLGINGQVCFLEKMLNDQYDPLRRIYIDKGVNLEPEYIYQDQAPDQLYAFLEEGDIKPPAYLYVDNETTSSSSDFIVMVPNDLKVYNKKMLNEAEMDTRLSMHALPDKVYAIQYF